MKKLRVGVIYGGRSSEHEVSIASAAAVFKNLDRKRYEPMAIRIEKDGRWTARHAIRIEWRGDRVARIRDYAHISYLLADARVSVSVTTEPAP